MPRKTPTEPKPSSFTDPWRGLTWDDLEEWVGARSLERGRSHQRAGRVQDLARTGEGALIAWVRGSERYATEVRRTDVAGRPMLTSRCTCPLGNACKHAVAVVVDYLAAIKKGRDVPAAAEADPRLALLTRQAEFPEPAEAGAGTAEGERRRSPPRSRGDALRTYLEGLPAADLIRYLLEVAERYPDIGRELKARSALARGESGEVVRQARDLIRQLTHEPAWYNPWTGEGSLPDYGGLKGLFERLLERGEADSLLGLGENLLDSGTQQMGAAHDEGETGAELSRCLEVVFRAVLVSSRSDADKLLFTIDLVLRDEYDLCRGADVVLDSPWTETAWSAVADELTRRLGALPPPRGDEFSDRFQRDRLCDWLLRALERSGRQAERIPLLEAEAGVTGSYDRLVETLLNADRREEARCWAREGIQRLGDKRPGTAQRLRDRLRELSEREQDWPTVAAMRAEEFFADPSVSAMRILDRIAQRAGCGAEVHAAALHFLETGERPAQASGRGKSRTQRPARWPLPEIPPELRVQQRPGRAGPYFDVLLELSLEERRPDDILRWYDRWRAGRRVGPYGPSGDSALEGRIADAVAEAHPDRAAALYREIIARAIARTSPHAYEEAMPFLRKLRALLHRTGREEEWRQYLGRLRETERRKRRLMEVLDRVERRPIVEG